MFDCFGFIENCKVCHHVNLKEYMTHILYYCIYCIVYTNDANDEK